MELMDLLLSLLGWKLVTATAGLGFGRNYVRAAATMNGSTSSSETKIAGLVPPKSHKAKAKDEALPPKLPVSLL